MPVSGWPRRVVVAALGALGMAGLGSSAWAATCSTINAGAIDSVVGVNGSTSYPLTMQAGDVISWSVIDVGVGPITTTLRITAIGFNSTGTSNSTARTGTITFSATGSSTIDLLNDVTSNTSANFTFTCTANPQSSSSSGAATIGNTIAQSTKYLAPRTLAASTAAISGLVGQTIKGSFERGTTPLDLWRRETGDVADDGAAAEPVLAAAETEPPAARRGGAARLGGFAEMAYSHLRSSERGGEYDGDIRNAVGGFDYRLTDALLVGLAGGYEWIDLGTRYNGGWLSGEGLTLAPYFGVAFGRFVWDVTMGHSWLTYDVAQGGSAPARGGYDAERDFLASSLTATYYATGSETYALRMAPSVGLLVAREKADGFVDTAGTAQPEVTARLGRASAGGEIGLPMMLGGTTCLCSLEPFVKAAALYDFVHNGRIVLTTGQLSGEQDWSGQVGGGFKFSLTQHLSGVLDASYNSLGVADLEVWSVRGRIDFVLPF